jgi:aminoglycoside phosphotransferase (APT) family kinase protein
VTAQQPGRLAGTGAQTQASTDAGARAGTDPQAVTGAGFGPDFAAWATDNVPGSEPPYRLTQVSGGRSNLTYLLTDGTSRQHVLRRPPLGTGPGSAHDVLREASIIQALAGSVVPVPAIAARCNDPAVIGAPFFVMEFVPGLVLTDPDSVPPAGRGALATPGLEIARAMAEALAAIHDLDLAERGLEGMRRPGSYARRQLRRLAPVIEQVQTGQELLRRVGEELGRQSPVQESAATLLHGDFKLANVILRPDCQIAAVLDWELASSGEPLADLGWLVASWAEPGDGPWLVPPATLAGGFPARAELADAYATASSRPLAGLPYFVALSFWRWSCINVRTRARYLEGRSPGLDLDVTRLDSQVQWQLERALELLSQEGNG